MAPPVFDCICGLIETAIKKLMAVFINSNDKFYFTLKTIA